MATKKDATVEIVELQTSTLEIAIIGRRPLILNRMSEKAQRQILLPKKKSNAEKQATLKHEPLTEYRDSCYRTVGDDQPTRLLHMSTAFKRAMTTAALDMPGAAKAQIGRLTWVEGSYVPIYGVPQILMSVVRNSDMNHTPDIRTRAIVPEWATHLAITFVRPIMKDKDVLNLLAAAGLIRGVGDWRTEKGSDTYGQFEIVSPNDPRYLTILKKGGRAAQDAALETPDCYNKETADLYAWCADESERRGFKVVA